MRRLILTDPEGTFMLRRIFLFILCILILPLENAAYGEVDGCIVGDESQGYWGRINLVPGECPISGPPDPDSSWLPDSDGSSNGYVFRIDGRYKILVSMSAEGFALLPPPSSPGCIDGYAEAYTSWACARHQSWYDNTSGPCTTIFTASSTLCTKVTTCPDYYYHVQYVRYFDVGHVLYEWVCTSQPSEPSVEENNQGPPCPPGQCCN